MSNLALPCQECISSKMQISSSESPAWARVTKLNHLPASSSQAGQVLIFVKTVEEDKSGVEGEEGSETQDQLMLL